jgi:hypothetical protein
MALNFEIYNNANSVSKTVTVDFFIDVLADPYEAAPTNENVYYMKFTTTAKDQDNISYSARVARSLDSLVLNRKNQTDGSNVAYETINALITDYIYDYITGHEANVYASEVSYKAPMKF